MAYVGLAIGIFFQVYLDLSCQGDFWRIVPWDSSPSIKPFGRMFFELFFHTSWPSKSIPSQKSCASIDDAAQEGFLERWGLQKSTFCFVSVSFLTPRTSQNIDTCSRYNAAVFDFKHLTCWMIEIYKLLLGMEIPTKVCWLFSIVNSAG